MLKIFTLLSCLILLAGCASHQQNVVASNNKFVVVETTSDDTYGSLATQYLGDRDLAGFIRRYNPGVQIKRGTNVVVPLQNLNPSGVFSNGYQKLPILCYHQFHELDSKAGGMVVSQSEFDRQMSYLKNNGYSVVPLSDVRPFLEGKKILPEKSVVITIDDGYESYFNVAYPILKKYGFHSTMFIYPDFINAGVSLDWRQVRVLENDPLVDIQSHSKTHESLSPRPEGEFAQDYLARLETEVVDTDKILERKIGRAATLFAYPYGDSSKQLVDLLEQREYKLAVTVKKGGNPTFAFPYLIRRTMVYGGTKMGKFKQHLEVFKKVNLQ